MKITRVEVSPKQGDGLKDVRGRLDKTAIEKLITQLKLQKLEA